MKNALILLVLVVGVATVAARGEATLADFTDARHGWRAVHDIASLTTTPQGLLCVCAGDDPHFVGPVIAAPVAPAVKKRLRVTLTCAPTACADVWKLFFAPTRTPFTEEASLQLYPDGTPPYTRFVGELPRTAFPTGKKMRLRLDPPSGTNAVTVVRLGAEFLTPVWTYTPPTPPPLELEGRNAETLAGANWRLLHDARRFGAFRLTACGKTVEGFPDEPVVMLDAQGAVRSLDWSRAPLRLERPSETMLVATAEIADADGRRWQIERRFARTAEDALAVTTTLSATPAARLLHASALTLFVDRAARGRKHQALLAGVEYLADEPSSNMCEIRTAEHDRRIPAEHRLTAPLAVFTDDAHWLAATWFRDPAEPRTGPRACAVVFDTPDRLYRSGGHLLAFWLPAVGPARCESECAVYAVLPFTRATHTVVLRAGAGATVAAALEAVITPSVLPEPEPIDGAAALDLLARGWLDSTIRRGTDVRHAIGGSFGYGLAGDAPVLMQHLAATLAEDPRAETGRVARLRATAQEMLARVKAADALQRRISHIRRPAPVLVADGVAQQLKAATDAVRWHVQNDLATGRRLWHAPKGRRDLGETLGDVSCNGYSAISLETMLESATWCGDEQLIAQALTVLERFTAQEHDTVPRGAQPWEMPLHTPDIVASGRLVHCYALAYLLRSDPAFLREARYWAYTGLSMVALVPPLYAQGANAADAVGLYATCGVMGATNWMNPNWIGRPVQWCGLVYAAALWDLARIEATPEAAAFWRRVATGITHSGVRQTHPRDDAEAVGCLPDSWDLVRQFRYPIPINPGTVQENLAEALNRPVYTVCALGRGTLLHMPGAATPLPATAEELHCQIAGWPETPFKIVISRVAPPQTVTLAGTPVAWTYEPAHRALVVTLPARARGELCLRASQTTRPSRRDSLSRKD